MLPAVIFCKNNNFFFSIYRLIFFPFKTVDNLSPFTPPCIRRKHAEVFEKAAIYWTFRAMTSSTHLLGGNCLVICSSI